MTACPDWYRASAPIYELEARILRRRARDGYHNALRNRHPCEPIMMKALIIVDIQDDFLPGGALTPQFGFSEASS